jgi:hypothetical protein
MIESATRHLLLPFADTAAVAREVLRTLDSL